MARYTTQLQAGLGMLLETRLLLDLWEPEVAPPELAEAAVASGTFPKMSARRVRNVVAECFAPRYLIRRDGVQPAKILKSLADRLPQRQFEQLLFLHTARANDILADFIRDVYWPAYEAGRTELSAVDARRFVVRANEDGLTGKYWSESTIRRVSAYLLGACGDFKLLSPLSKGVRAILPFRIEESTAVFLAYDLHFNGYGDNRVIRDSDWALFGLRAEDVVSEMKQLSAKGWFILQSAGSVTKVSWRFRTMEEVADAIAAI